MPSLSKEDTQLIQNLITERNLKKGAFRRFQSPITNYLKFHQNKYTMTQLIQEAKIEQDKTINPQKTKLYTYLTEFRIYLNERISPRTLQNYMIQVKEVYRHYDVCVPQLKPFQLREPPQVTYDDLPTHNEIRQAVNISPIDMRALILFQSSSGTTLHESCTITVKMFFEACKEYLENFQPFSVRLVLTKLQQQEPIVPIFHLERVKTNKYYYTCCSPEATTEIIKYLQFRLDSDEILTLDSKLFPYPKSTYTKRFWALNKQLKLGFVGKYGKFRSHALRKFHASNIGCGVELIDELQGRGKTTIHEAYIKDRPQKIKEDYMKYMDNVMINNVHATSVSIEDTVDESVCESNQFQQTNTNQQTVDTNMYKEIGKLELKIELLEERIKQLEGRIG